MEQRLNSEQIDSFISDGYIRLDNVFSEETAAAARAILWEATGCDPDDPSGWTRPVIRLGEYGQEPFRQAVSNPRLHTAFDQLVGEGNWLPRVSLGTFPIRFPGDQDPGDTGWHVDASFPGEDPYNYMEWRINIHSRGRALLMLFLFSDVGEKDAPTRIRVASHLDVARILEPAGETGMSAMELARETGITAARKEVYATGKAGTVYLCHPFLVHAAQKNRGTMPKFMAQPPLLLRNNLQLQREDNRYSPVETAIRRGLGLS